MDVETFKSKLGRYWHDSLSGVPEESRQDLAEILRDVIVTDDELSKVLIPQITRVLGMTGEDVLEKTVKTLTEMARKSDESALYLASNFTRILRDLSILGADNVLPAFEVYALLHADDKKEYHRHIIEKTVPWIKQYGVKTYHDIVKEFIDLEKEGKPASDFILEQTGRLLERLGPKTYIHLVQTCKRMNERNSMLTFEGYYIILTEEGNPLQDRPVFDELLDTLLRVFEKDNDCALGLVLGLGKYAKNITASGKTPTLNNILLESITDQKSAHAVGQVIDKQKYGKQYAEKCGRFY